MERNPAMKSLVMEDRFMEPQEQEFCAEIKELSVSFGSRQVLKEISVNFPAKKVSVLLGRSGSGKTTLLRSLNRLNECFEDYRGTGSVKMLLPSVVRKICDTVSIEAQFPRILRPQAADSQVFVIEMARSS
ncbi:MAG: ATP-binding cassette domain-containing protein [Synergistaceae bacterium]|jgi:ABC-type phosphate transport system ATPase subunit|nr:ATP-binding cassette domain-containing protein [Synergistaceae bacterium]